MPQLTEKDMHDASVSEQLDFFDTQYFNAQHVTSALFLLRMSPNARRGDLNELKNNRGDS